MDFVDKHKKKNQTEDAILIVSQNVSISEKRKVILKPHKLFCHTSADWLLRIIKIILEIKQNNVSFFHTNMTEAETQRMCVLTLLILQI